MGISIVDGTVAAGKAGDGAAFLVRGSEMYPFFERKSDEGLTAHQQQEQLVGAHSLVSVELSSVPLEPGDLVLCFSQSLEPAAERRLSALVAAGSFRETRIIDAVLGKLWGRKRWPSYALLLKIGPKSLYLDEPLVD